MAQAVPYIGGSGVCTPDGGTDVLFLLDNSGSIDASEYSAFAASVASVGETLLAARPTTRIAVAHYAGPMPVGSVFYGEQEKVYFERDFSSTAPSAPLRRFGPGGVTDPALEMDSLAAAVHRMGFGLDGNPSTTSAHFLSPLKELNRDLSRPLQIVVFTDAIRGASVMPSAIIDDVYFGSGLSDGSNFTIYNQYKAQGVKFSVAALPSGVSAAEDAARDPAAAAIASLGGSWMGSVESNPLDVEGSGTKPRRLVASTNFNLSAAQILDLVPPIVNLCPPPSYDYGDAPASYGAPRHAVAANGARLGYAAIDSESAPHHSAGADGDDLNGIDDEDGIVFGAMEVGQSSLTTAHLPYGFSSGYLSAWVDWNRDGDFLDPGEQVATNLRDNGADDDGAPNDYQIQFIIDVPATAVVGQNYLSRFRLSTQASLAPHTGDAPDGEIEDHLFTAQAFTPPTSAPIGACAGPNQLINGDFSSAANWAAGYQTSPASGGVAIGLAGMNSTLTGTPAYAQNASGVFRSYVDNDGNLGGVPYLHLRNETSLSVVNGQSYVFSTDFQRIVNTAYISGTVDWVLINPTTNAIVQTIPGVAVDIAAEPGNAWVQKGSTFLATVPTGTYKLAMTFKTAANGTGQVMDYYLDRVYFAPSYSCDFGDAPESYGVPTHILSGTLKLGANAPDAETAAHHSAAANGDDLNGIDDEDGISTFPPLQTGATSYSIPAANLSVTGTGTLHAWIDFDKNGVFTANEHASVAATSGVLAGPLNWIGISVGAPGPTIARLRLTWTTLTDAATPALDERSTAPAHDGEVEDHALTIQSASSNICPAGTTQLFAEDFGQGGPRSSSYVVGHSYSNDPTQIQDGAYQINNPRSLNLRHFGYGGLDDHTPGDANGAALAINMVNSPIVFYRRPVNILGTAPVSFQLWMTGTCPGCGDLGQIEFLIEDSSGNVISQSGSSFAVPNDQVWYKRDYVFDPQGRTSFTIALRNAAASGLDGNDIMLDDIALCQVEADYSDAPASYGGPYHGIVGDLKLGANAADADSGPQPTADASGDDADGFDDEDGISVVPPLQVSLSSSYSLPAANISATGTGMLHAWIDFDLNGVFTAGEHASVVVTEGVLAGPLNWTGITRGIPGQSFLRLRFTSSALRDDEATAHLDERAVIGASEGEVEDHAILITRPDRNTLPPFACDDQLYVGYGVTGILSSLDLRVGALNQLTYEYGTSINAAGYRRSDNLAYMLNGGGATRKYLLVVGANGQLLNQGQIVGLPVNSYAAGDFDGDGRLVVRSSHAGGVDLAMRVIDVDAVSVVDSFTPAGLPTGIFDFAYDPTEGWFYTVAGTQVWRFRQDVAAAQLVGATGLPSSQYDAIFSNGGRLFAADAVLGMVYEIDKTTGAANVVGSMPIVTNPDGFSCPTAVLLPKVDFSIAKTNDADSLLPGQTTTYLVTVRNEGPATVNGAILSDPVAAGLNKTSVACSASAPGRCVAPPTIAELEGGSFALPNMAAGQSYSFVVTAQVVAEDGSVRNTASISAPSAYQDYNLTNNLAADLDGVVDGPFVLRPDHESTVEAGQLAVYPHNLHLSEGLDGGALSFVVASERGLEWSLLRDEGDGVYGAGDLPWVQGSAIPAGEHLFWLVAKTPQDAPGGWSDLTRLTARIVKGDMDLSGEVEDLTFVGGEGSGRLTARKLVALDADCDGDADGGEASFGTEAPIAQSACAVYRIIFENLGVDPIRQVRVHDHTPSWTVYKGAQGQATSYPASLTPLPPILPPLDQGGEIVFPFDGVLNPGERGVVEFGVQIRPLPQPTTAPPPGPREN